MGFSSADLKIVSLARYIDACDPASRHRDCPYAVERDGEFTCREECRDVLAFLLRRGRAPSELKVQSFDARQLLLSEIGLTPDVLWHTSSLLQVVVKVARTHPLREDGSFNLRRFIDATSALGALGCRGLDPEKLVRRGVAKTIKLTISGWLEILESSDEPRRNAEQFTQWRAFFKRGSDEPVSPGYYIEAALFGRCARRLSAWLETAPLEDLLRWRLPERWPEAPSPTSVGEEAESWTWIVERFTETYLGQWSLESLKKEYTFLKGSWQSDLPTEVLDERTLSREEVTAELAERAVVDGDSIDPATMSSLTTQAVALLMEGQRRAAAALMDGARRLKPSDLVLQQNYAFCLLPDEPERARTLFKDVLAREKLSPRVTLCNLALAEAILGNTSQALETCTEALYVEPETGTAYLWVRGAEGWNIETTSMHRWIIRLGADIEASQDVKNGPWMERLASLHFTEQQDSSADPSTAGTDEADL
ncbi:hypothetical protein [Spirillospora sp. NPDC048824]|uniref:hypothetical protein n=1 Tax=Spirillospora sp. NPDC048824 TaxID=3364526 RepID=UPI00371B0CD6